MRGLFAAVAFLTTIPVPRRLLGDEPASPSAMLWWWTPVGALIGALAAAITWLASLVLPWPTCAAIGVVSLVVLSGGLHLEGFMDTCDGLGSRAPRERALEIMKDPRAGAFGVIGVVCLLLLKIAFVAGMDPAWGIPAIILAPVWARVMQVATLAGGVRYYARPDGGMAQAFFASARLTHGLVAALVAAAAVASLQWASPGADLLAREGAVQTAVPAMGCSLPVIAVVEWQIRKRLGGHTGDTVGAISELSELLILAAFAIFSRF